jgi:glutamate dehydrogenase (NAD(P)+)
MSDIFAFTDALGPCRVVHVSEPSLGLRGVLVIDNIARGPSIGGLRMAPDVTLEEGARLARAMTLKNSAAGLPHGGGKSVLQGDPRMPLDRKTSRSCARSSCWRARTSRARPEPSGISTIGACSSCRISSPTPAA